MSSTSNSSSYPESPVRLSQVLCLKSYQGSLCALRHIPYLRHIGSLHGSLQGFRLVLGHFAQAFFSVQNCVAGFYHDDVGSILQGYAWIRRRPALERSALTPGSSLVYDGTAGSFRATKIARAVVKGRVPP